MDFFLLVLVMISAAALIERERRAIDRLRQARATSTQRERRRDS